MKVRKFNQPETRQCNSEPVWTKNHIPLEPDHDTHTKTLILGQAPHMFRIEVLLCGSR